MKNTDDVGSFAQGWCPRCYAGGWVEDLDPTGALATCPICSGTGRGGSDGIPGGAQRAVSAGEAAGGGQLHPNVIEALEQLESVRETVAEMGMWFAARQIAQAKRTLSDHLTRKAASGGNDQAQPPAETK